jgi:hypothetical protein
MLPLDVARCAGRKPFTADRCQRRDQCARWLAKSGPASPFYLSVCEQGDKFIHAETVAAPAAADHPLHASSERVMSARTGEQAWP